MECRSVLHCIAPIRNRHAALRPHRCSQRSVASAEPRAAHRSWCSRCCRMEKPGNLQSVVRRLARASLSRSPARTWARPRQIEERRLAMWPHLPCGGPAARPSCPDWLHHPPPIGCEDQSSRKRPSLQVRSSARASEGSVIEHREFVGGGAARGGAALTARPVEFRNPSNQHDRARRPSMRGSCFAASPASR